MELYRCVGGLRRLVYNARKALPSALALMDVLEKLLIRIVTLVAIFRGVYEFFRAR